MSKDTRSIGHSIAPWRFLLFACVFAAASGTLFHWLGLRRGVMGGFDMGALAF